MKRQNGMLRLSHKRQPLLGQGVVRQPARRYPTLRNTAIRLLDSRVHNLKRFQSEAVARLSFLSFEECEPALTLIDPAGRLARGRWTPLFDEGLQPAEHSVFRVRGPAVRRFVLDSEETERRPDHDVFESIKEGRAVPHMLSAPPAMNGEGLRVQIHSIDSERTKMA